MQTSRTPDEPARRSAHDNPGGQLQFSAAPERGAPSTYAAHAFRKDVSVRVLVRPTWTDSEEREHGYGHGV